METSQAAVSSVPPERSTKLLTTSTVVLSITLAVLLGCLRVGAAKSTVPDQQPPSRLPLSLVFTPLLQAARLLFSVPEHFLATLTSALLIVLRAVTQAIPSALIWAAGLMLRAACKQLLSAPKALAGASVAVTRSSLFPVTTMIAKLTKYMLASSRDFVNGDLGTWETAVKEASGIAYDYSAFGASSPISRVKLVVRMGKMVMKPIFEDCPKIRLALALILGFEGFLYRMLDNGSKGQTGTGSELQF